jgi:hypothetical protein
VRAENTSCRRVLVEHSDGAQEVVEIKNDIGIKADDLVAMRKRLVEQGMRARGERECLAGWPSAHSRPRVRAGVKDIARISLAE